MGVLRRAPGAARLAALPGISLGRHLSDPQIRTWTGRMSGTAPQTLLGCGVHLGLIPFPRWFPVVVLRVAWETPERTKAPVSVICSLRTGALGGLSRNHFGDTEDRLPYAAAGLANRISTGLDSE